MATAVLDAVLRQAEDQVTPASLDLSCLPEAPDGNFVSVLMAAMQSQVEVCTLDLSHNDLAAGCEEELYQLQQEKAAYQREVELAEKEYTEARKDRDFSVMKQKQNKADAKKIAAEKKVEEITGREMELEGQCSDAGWSVLLTRWEQVPSNIVQTLRLSNAGLTAVALTALRQSVLTMEGRPGENLHTLVLDGNDFGDHGAQVLGGLLRQSKHLQHVSARNTGLTEVGVGALVAGLLGNTTLQTLDIRSNGKCTTAARFAVDSAKHFNKTVKIIFD
mmetsp:Transcript_51537/g.110450  ORF Transcript_51537/g.110450 Transcript_51537/m.110450 type:complete len:276 (-) Transcript_51537:99-926(-)